MNEINVSQNGKKLDSKKYVWNPETKTFSTNESDLVLDFGSMDNVTINCVSVCTINCVSVCTINCGFNCTINCGSSCTIKCGNYCTIKCGNYCTIKCGNVCTINCGSGCTINCVHSCTIKCGNYCTIKCGNYCTIRCYWDTTIIPEKNCILNYIYSDICESYKLQEQIQSKILKNGKLEIVEQKTETELQIESLKKTIEEANQKVLELQKQVQKKGWLNA